MKNKLFSGLIALMMIFAAVSFTSCEKNDIVTDNIVEVAFNIHNPSMDPGLKNGSDELPTCIEGAVPAYVIVEFLNGDEFEVDVLSSYDETMTQTIKFNLGPDVESELLTIVSFEVYAADGEEPIWVSPLAGSTYSLLLENPLDLEFTVEAFKKAQIDIDVVCWVPAEYDNFGYNWLAFHKYKVYEVCFFGDVCTKFYTAWGADAHDFPARFSVQIVDADNNDVTVYGDDFTAATNGGLTYAEIDGPLCVEYVDNLEDMKSGFTAIISLILPDGSEIEITRTPIEGNILTEAGEDNVFDFLAGGSDCMYDADYDVLVGLPWVPVPTEVNFTLKTGTDSYVRLLINSVMGAATPEFVVGNILNGWCGNKDLHITYQSYKAKVYPYYAIPAESMYAAIEEYKWDQLNWIVNNLEGKTSGVVQNAIWKVLGHTVAANDFYNEAIGHIGYIAPIGGFMVVLVNPYQTSNGGPVLDDVGNVVTDAYQLMLVRVDP